MIRGSVSDYREPIIIVKIPVDSESFLEFDAVVDTGFNGFLTLPLDALRRIGASKFGRVQVTLADGSDSICDLFKLKIDWNGTVRTIEVDAAETMPLVGMKLLDGFILTVDATIGGSVTISPR